METSLHRHNSLGAPRMISVLPTVSFGKVRSVTETCNLAVSTRSAAAGCLKYISSVIERPSSSKNRAAGRWNGKGTNASVVTPRSIFPNFTAESASGPVNFWEWAEDSWTYVVQLSENPIECVEELLSYAMASTQLRTHDIKVLGVNAMPVLELGEISQDVSAIAGRQLSVTMVSDELNQLSDILCLQSYEHGATAPVHRSFLIGPDLRLRACQTSSFRLIASASETITHVKRMQQSLSGTGSECLITQHCMKQLSA